MLKDDPSLRCNVTSDCLKRVSGGHAVYCAVCIYNIPTHYEGDSPFESFVFTLQPDIVVLKALYEDFTKYNGGPCRFTVLKEGIMSTNSFTLLQKNSPYREHFNRGCVLLCARNNNPITCWSFNSNSTLSLF